MKIYFLSSQPCALTVNGAYFGLTDGFERFADVSLRDNLYLQFSPQNGLPNGFFLTENIRFQPPVGVEVYLLKDALALYARDFTPVDFALKTHAQKRFDRLLITLFTQGETQISIESERGFFVQALPRDLAQAELSMFCDLIFVHTTTQLAIYTQTGKLLFHERILSFSVNDDVLSVSLPISNALQQTADCRYALSPENCVRTACTFKQAVRKQGDCPDNLIAYAFFESVRLGLDCTPFLSDDLQPRANDLAAFLGEYTAVVPTQRTNECGLVQKLDERLFSVAYFQTEICEGKICDVHN